MFIIIEILTDTDNTLRMISDTIFPTLDSAKEYLNKDVQCKVNDEACRTFEKLKGNEQAMEYFKNHNSDEIVVKNFVIVPLAEVVSLQNEKLF